MTNKFKPWESCCEQPMILPEEKHGSFCVWCDTWQENSSEGSKRPFKPSELSGYKEYVRKWFDWLLENDEEKAAPRVIDLTEERNRLKGIHTVQAVLENAAEWARYANDEDGLDSVIIIYKRKDGVIDFAYSHSQATERIALCEIAKQEFLDQIRL